MLLLTAQKDSRWLDLDGLGVRVKIRPLTAAVVSAARSEAGKRVAALWTEAEAAKEAGMPLDPTGANVTNPNWRVALGGQFYVEALIRYAVEAWEGVVGEDGEPLPINAVSAKAFAEHDEAADAFVRAALAPIEALAAEGNAFAPSSPGAGGEGASTVTDAERAAAPPAPEH